VLPLEEALAETISGIREWVADGDPDDVLDAWGLRGLDERPLIVVVAAMGSETMLWATQPGADPERDAMLHAHTRHWGRALTGLNCTEVTLDGTSRLMHDIATDVGWLVKEKTGSFPNGQ
jgi:hypothetical protein